MNVTNTPSNAIIHMTPEEAKELLSKWTKHIPNGRHTCATPASCVVFQEITTTLQERGIEWESFDWATENICLGFLCDLLQMFLQNKEMTA